MNTLAINSWHCTIGPGRVSWLHISAHYIQNTAKCLCHVVGLMVKNWVILTHWAGPRRLRRNDEQNEKSTTHTHKKREKRITQHNMMGILPLFRNGRYANARPKMSNIRRKEDNEYTQHDENNAKQP